MKRPLPEKSTEELRDRQLLMNQLARGMSSGWLDFLYFKAVTEFQRVVLGPMRCMSVLNSNSYTSYENKKTLYSVLGLNSIENNITPGRILRVPEHTPTKGDPYFPQFAVVWEPKIDDCAVESNTLRLEICSGFYGVSLKFLKGSVHRSDKTAMWLDGMEACHAHEYIDLNIEHPDASLHIQRFIRQAGELVELLLRGDGNKVQEPLAELVDGIRRTQHSLVLQSDNGSWDDDDGNDNNNDKFGVGSMNLAP
ncbi:MAG: hypothetical protein PHX61_08740 [Alphaproteobacteria bacterium]|nr:hypothetical protein [Alphaproteobacteria bacterium]